VPIESPIQILPGLSDAPRDNDEDVENENENVKESTSETDEKQETEYCENTNTHEATDKDYISVIKKVKKDNITPDNIGEIMLCQIPGISCVTALAIMDKFKTISNLITSIEKDEKCLDNIVYTTSKNQQRKINKSSILNISKFLLKK
jgi:ERCC4-type nuclease